MSSPEAPAESVKDFMGRPVTAGSTIVYPVRRGSSMWLQKLAVTQVVSGTKPQIAGFNKEGRRITIHNIDNVVIVEPVKPAEAV